MGAIYHLLGVLSQAMQQNQNAQVCAWDDNTENEHPIIDVLSRDNYLNIYIKEEPEGREGSLSIKEIYDKVRVASLHDLKGVRVLDFITGDKHGYWGADYDEYEGFYMNIYIEGGDDDDDDDEGFTLNQLFEGLEGLRGNKKVMVQDENDEQMAIRMIRYDDEHEDFNIVITNEKGITWTKMKREIEQLQEKHGGDLSVDIYNQTNEDFLSISKIGDGIIFTFEDFREGEGDFEPATVKEVIEHLEDYDDPDEQEVGVFVNIEDEDGDALWTEGELGIIGRDYDDEQQIVIQPDDVLTRASESFEAEVDYTYTTRDDVLIRVTHDEFVSD